MTFENVIYVDGEASIVAGRSDCRLFVPKFVWCVELASLRSQIDHAFFYLKLGTDVLNVCLVDAVVEAKDGTISVASAFAGHQEGMVIGNW